MRYTEIKDHPYVGRTVKADWMPVAQWTVGVIEKALLGEDGVTKFVFRRPGSPECRYIERDDILAISRAWPPEVLPEHCSNLVMLKPIE